MKTRGDWVWLIGVTLASIGIAAACHQAYGSTWLEMSAFVTSAVAVYLVVREHLWNWPIGIVSVVLYSIFFFQEKLNGDASLQIVFFVAQVHGWYSWMHGGENQSALRVQRTPSRYWLWIVVAFFGGYAALVPILFQIAGKQPWMDGLTTAMSLVAQFMLNRKLIENWLVWIAVDLIYVPWYWYLGYKPTALLYIVFLVLAVAGYLEWRKTITPSGDGSRLNP